MRVITVESVITPFRNGSATPSFMMAKMFERFMTCPNKHLQKRTMRILEPKKYSVTPRSLYLRSSPLRVSILVLVLVVWFSAMMCHDIVFLFSSRLPLRDQRSVVAGCGRLTGAFRLAKTIIRWNLHVGHSSMKPHPSVHQWMGQPHSTD